MRSLQSRILPVLFATRSGLILSAGIVASASATPLPGLRDAAGEAPASAALVALVLWDYPLLLAAVLLVVGGAAGALVHYLFVRKNLQRSGEQNRSIGMRDRMLQAAGEDLLRIREQLAYANKMASLGELTAGIAHEIRNPLNFISNFASVVADLADELKSSILQCSGSLEHERRSEMDELADDLSTTAEKIVEHGKRIDSIVRSMLLHAHGKPGEREVLDVNAFVDQYATLSWHGMRAQRQDFAVELLRRYGEDAGEISVVPQDLARVLVNLLNNAYHAVLSAAEKAGPKFEPSVTLETWRTGEQVMVAIRDNGGGVPEDLEKKIFEPFFTTKSSGSGTGLGLSLSQDLIANALGGQLYLENEQGVGASFVIVLPVRQQ